MTPKNYISFLLIMLLCSAQSTLCISTKMFSGSIEFPISSDYDVCLFYKGQKLEFETHQSTPFVQFTFVDSSKTQTLYLIITNSLSCYSKESNNVECLCVADESSYLCYQLQGQRELDEQGNQILNWQSSSYYLPKGQIPENSVIFLFDPNLISGLKIQSWKPENVFRIIPTIVINPTSTIEQIQRALIVARLAALDIDAIHRKQSMNTSTTNAILTVMQ